MFSYQKFVKSYAAPGKEPYGPGAAAGNPEGYFPAAGEAGISMIRSARARSMFMTVSSL